MIPLAIVQAAISWSSDIHTNAQGGSEASHWVKAAIESEHELIQIGRQVLLTHAVVSSQQPCFQVGEDQVNHGQCLLRFVHVAIKHNRCMAISESRQVAVARPTVGRDTAMRQDISVTNVSNNFPARSSKASNRRRPAYMLRRPRLSDFSLASTAPTT